MASNTIKLRATVAEGQVTIKALITHPMELGTRKNAKTGELIPAHFIQDITVSHAGNAVVTGAWSGGVPKDPYLSVRQTLSAVISATDATWDYATQDAGEDTFTAGTGLSVEVTTNSGFLPTGSTEYFAVLYILFRR